MGKGNKHSDCIGLKLKSSVLTSRGAVKRLPRRPPEPGAKDKGVRRKRGRGEPLTVATVSGVRSRGSSMASWLPTRQGEETSQRSEGQGETCEGRRCGGQRPVYGAQLSTASVLPFPLVTATAQLCSGAGSHVARRRCAQEQAGRHTPWMRSREAVLQKTWECGRSARCGPGGECESVPGSGRGESVRSHQVGRGEKGAEQYTPRRCKMRRRRGGFRLQAFAAMRVSARFRARGSFCIADAHSDKGAPACPCLAKASSCHASVAALTGSHGSALRDKGERMLYLESHRLCRVSSAEELPVGGNCRPASPTVGE